jgi:hypothetical protein
MIEKSIDRDSEKSIEHEVKSEPLNNESESFNIFI